MKKITKTNFQGLRQLFPVLEKEEMRHYVGGSSDGYYYNSGWNGSGDYYGSSGSGDSSYYSQYDFDNWEGPWYGGWVEGMGWVAPEEAPSAAAEPVHAGSLRCRVPGRCMLG